MLCKDIGAPSDFGTLRYVGACLMPWAAVEPLSPEPSGLYEVLWRRRVRARGGSTWSTTARWRSTAARPADYLAANLHASGGRSVVGAGAVVEGAIDRCVVWPGAYVGPDERLVDTIRAGTRDQPVTVPAAPDRRPCEARSGVRPGSARGITRMGADAGRASTLVLMSEYTAPQPPPQPQPAAAPRRLTRVRDGKMIAGVSTGLARYLGVDPVVVRVGLRRRHPVQRRRRRCSTSPAGS